MKKLIVLSIFYLLVGCSTEPKIEFEPALNVSFIVDASRFSNHFYISRLHRLNEPDTTEYFPIDVTITDSIDSLHYHFDRTGFFSVSHRFKHGITYYLDVVTDRFPEVTGVMTVPETSYVISPENGDRVSGFVNIKIDVGRFTGGYGIYLDSYIYPDTSDSSNFTGIVGVFNGIEDSIFNVVLNTRFLYVKTYFEFYALDSNYAEYEWNKFYGMSDDFPLQYGIKGGYGIFGSFFRTDSLILYTSP